MLIKNVCLGIGIILTDIHGLLQCHQTGNRVAIWKILVMLSSAGTLNKDHIFSGFAVRWADDLTFSGNLFKLGVGDDIFAADGKMFIFRDISRDSACGQYNSTILFSIGIIIHIVLQAGIRVFHLALVDGILFINPHLGGSIPFTACATLL